MRRERLFVRDEIDNALSYFRDIFMPVLPGLYARWDRVVGKRVPGFLKLGTWIGGDRDGNPFVQADQLRLALGRASGSTLRVYMEMLHELGAQLSISSELAAVPAAVKDLAAASGDESPSRRDEPYRRAITGIYARVAATYEKLTGTPAPRPSRLRGKPYDNAAQLRADLATLGRGLAMEGNGALSAGGALSRLIRAVELFGFHLATLDMRQKQRHPRARRRRAAQGGGRRSGLSRAR